MRQFIKKNDAFVSLFLEKSNLNNSYSILKVENSIMTNDGETDVEAILSIGGKKVAFLIEDKIDAVAQPEQSKRYEIRAKKAKDTGEFDEYYIFIVAPQKYLDGNKEAAKYSYNLSYEDLRNTLYDEYDIAVIDCAIDESKKGYIPIEDRNVTQFWDKMFDYIDKRFPDIFTFYSKKGDIHGSNACWVSIKSGKGTKIVIKSDRGYVDLEIAGYTEKFQEFSKANQELLDSKRLYLRMASKSLAIRKYIDCIDFTMDFDEQIPLVEMAFVKAKELQDLVKDLKI